MFQILGLLGGRFLGAWVYQKIADAWRAHKARRAAANQTVEEVI
jgi:hypothetical protein